VDESANLFHPKFSQYSPKDIKEIESPLGRRPPGVMNIIIKEIL
jgi:hypothetical protein